MTILLYHAVGPDGLDYLGEIPDKVIGRAGDHWSIMANGMPPVKVYRTVSKLDTLAQCKAAKALQREWHGKDYDLIWMDGQPWPVPQGGPGRPRKR